ncbi:exodeoxyribonuclease V subunit alpha [Chromatium okenii]|uniref:RecBCD enzyme subunit RecD n=1 Tax=Chromatium okenii TaxID=61644 RepID=A0A2S7XUI9_9GAMM|nr:exodeoxyribonuclease V subunit alpha [Chromatium okenii]PQJ97101.1 exodeoxyribonuclease V subunit alpha [Chromatium okenii]
MKPLLAKDNISPPLAKGGWGDLPWEKIACALAARSAFAIITGGPGTGKTTTVVRLLALLQGLTFDAKQPPLRIRLAAPTGKAAARLNASIAGRIADLPLAALANGEQIRAAIPTSVTTLHRLLEPLPHSRHFRYHAGNPLPVDLVVVDEASMVDVEMMARLLEALRPEARLILLGDKDQLASVEAGAVLGDLCAGAAAAHYTPATGDWLQRVTGATLPNKYIDPAGLALAQVTVMLRHSYRFRADGGIGALAAVVNAEPTTSEQLDPTQRFNAALQLFPEKSSSIAQQPNAAKQLTAIQLPNTQANEFIDLVCDGYRGYLAAMHDDDPGDNAAPTAIDAWAHTVLAAQAEFQLLAVLREGIWGVTGLNQHIVTLLQQKGLLRIENATGTPSQWFAGRPVLVTRNDANLQLMNGDIGITLAVPVRNAEPPHLTRRVLRVAFPRSDGSNGIRWVLPSRLQAVETVFAMTVHKAQGSEFTHTALVLPDAVNPVLTQELIYTAITRSKQRFTLLYTQSSVLGEALCRRVVRSSGIANSLKRLNISTENAANV